MHIQHLTAGEYVTSTWAGGITRQIAIRPPGAQYSQRDFLWRLSSAQVDLEESDFTALPDYRRYIAVLAGEIRLSHQGGPWIELPAFRVHAFDGAHATRCLGRCTDFNLMLRKGRCEGSMAALELPAGAAERLHKSQGHALAVYCAQGDVMAEAAGGQYTLRRGDTLLLEGEAGDCTLRSPQGAMLMLARVQPPETDNP